MIVDLNGSEQVLLHAEKDLTTKVEHDASHWVGHDEITTVASKPEKGRPARKTLVRAPAASPLE